MHIEDIKEDLVVYYYQLNIFAIYACFYLHHSDEALYIIVIILSLSKQDLVVKLLTK